MEAPLIPREDTVKTKTKAIKDMTPKERKAWFKERMGDLVSNQRQAKIRHEVMISTDGLLVSLRERMYMSGNIRFAEVVDGLRDAKKKAQG